MIQIELKNFLVFFFSRLSGLALSLHMARCLTIYNFGLFQKIQLIIGLVPFLHFGLMNGFQLVYGRVDDLNSRESLVSTYFKSSLVIQIFFSVLLAFYLKIFLAVDTLLSVMVLLFLNLSKVLEIILNISLVECDFPKQIKVRLFFEVLPSVISLVLFSYFTSLTCYFVGGCLSYSFFILFFFRANQGLKKKIDYQFMCMLLKTGFPVYLIWLIDFLFRSADRYVVSLFYSNLDLARYSFVQILSLACWSGVMSATSPQSQQLISLFSQNKLKEARELYIILKKKLYLYGFVVCVGCFVFYKLTTFYYVKNYSGHEWLMIVSLLGAFALIVNNINIYSLAAMSKVRFMLKMQIVVAITGLIMMLIIVKMRFEIIILASGSFIVLLSYYFILEKKVKKVFCEF